MGSLSILSVAYVLINYASMGVLGLQVAIPGLQPQCYSQHGDLNLGLLIRLHNNGHWPQRCSNSLYSVKRLSYLEAFVYAIKSVNARQDLLPNITLGFLVLDTCANRVAAISRSLYFIPSECGTKNETNTVVENCVDGPPNMDIIGIVGPPSSGDAVLVGSLLSGFQIPLISPSATSDELSDKTRYEYFLRMVPPDEHQIKAMTAFLLHYNWTYVSLLYSQGEYGINAADHFAKQTKQEGVCISVTRMFLSDVTSEEADDIYRKLLTDRKSRAVVLFLKSSHQRALFGAARRSRRQGNAFRFVWVASDYMMGKDYGDEMSGAFIMYHSFPRVQAFEDYYRGLTPQTNPDNPWMRGFWELIHGCTWNQTGNVVEDPCENHTVYRQWEDYIDTYIAAYIDAVYAYAHALHTMIAETCPTAFANPSEVRTCVNRPLLLTILRNQTFQGVSGKIQFDAVGNAVAEFKIWQFINNRTKKHQEVGSWHPDTDTEVRMDVDLVDWSPFTNDNNKDPHDLNVTNIPESICSKPCGDKQNIIPTDISCCWLCGTCRNNEILVLGRTGCKACGELMWPDEKTQSICLYIEPNYVHPGGGTGLVLLIIASIALLATVTIMVWYYRHSNEKLIKASSRELSTVIFSGMLLAYITVLALVMRPTNGVCWVVRFGFHVAVTLIFAPLLIRTLRIYRIFTGSKKGNRQLRLVGSRSQLVLTAILLVPEILLILVTCLLAPPTAQLRQPIVSEKLVELFCGFSVEGVLPALSYNLVLLVVCAVLGFLTRRLPDNFSESWYIFVAVTTTLVLWTVTLPALLTSLYASHRYILAGTCLVTNAGVTLCCLFLPKVYAVYYVTEERQNLKLVEATRVGTVHQEPADPGHGNHDN